MSIVNCFGGVSSAIRGQVGGVSSDIRGGGNIVSS